MNKIITDVHIPDDAWEATGSSEDDLETRLLAVLCINGTHHHLEAHEVKISEDDIQEVKDSTFESNYEGMCMASEPDGRYQTTEIRGKEYVLVATPYC